MTDLPSLDLSPLNDIKKIITCDIVGIVEPDDIANLAFDSGPAGSEPGDLSRIREKHHNVARLIASGLSQRLVAATANYTESYLSVLLNNPSMQELIELYRAQQNQGAEIIAERLRTVALTAVEKLAEKMEGEDGLTGNELLGLAKLGLDRSGHGPQAKHHHVTENYIFDQAELQRLNRDARNDSRERIITQPALPAPQDEEDDDAGA